MDENNVNSPAQQAAEALVQQKREPGIISSIGNVVSNAFTPNPELVAQEQEISRLAAQQGLDPQAIRAQVQQNQIAPQSLQPPPAVTNESQFSPSDFVAKPQQPIQPVQTEQPINDMGMGDSFKREQRALQAAGEAGALKAEAEASYLQNVASKQAKQELAYKDLQKEIDEKSNIEITKMQDVQKSMSNYKFEDYWANKGTGQKVMAGIAIALGGIGATAAGQENMALKVINDAIDRDMQRQKLEFQKLESIGQLGNSVLSQMNTQFDNKFAAEKAAEASLINAAQVQLQSIAAKYQAPEIRAKTQALNEQLERQKIGVLQQIKQATADQILMQKLTSGENLQGQTLAPAVLQKLPKNMQDSYVPQYGFASNPELANQFNKARTEIESAITGAKRILEATKDFNRITDLSERARIKTELQALVGNLRLPFTGPGAMTDNEYQRLADTIGDPTSLASLPKVQRAKLETVLKKLETDLKGKAKAAGILLKEPPKYNFTKTINK